MQLGKYFSQESRDTHSSDGRTVHIWSVDRVRSSICKQEKEERRSLVNSSPRLPCKFTRQTAWLAVPAYLNLQGEKQIPNHFLPYPPLKIWFSFKSLWFLDNLHQRYQKKRRFKNIPFVKILQIFLPRSCLVRLYGIVNFAPPSLSILSTLKRKRKRERGKGNISNEQSSRWESRRWIERKNNSLSDVRGNCALARFANLDPPAD